VRLARYVDPNGSHATDNHVELKRTDGTITILRFAWRMLPRNGGRAILLVCSYCNTPRRHVYSWEWDSFSGWSKQGQANQLAMPFMCQAALLLRRRLSVSGRHVSGIRKSTTPRIVAALHLYVHR
jgi:hypothetical protein